MPISGKKRREMKNRAEDGLIARIREELPDLEEREHRPHILYRGGAFIVLYNGGLSPLTQASLKTLQAFQEDIHGSLHFLRRCEEAQPPRHHSFYFDPLSKTY